MNGLYDRNAAHAPMRELLTILDELFDLTRRHFAEEEKYMESIRQVRRGVDGAALIDS